MSLFIGLMSGTSADGMDAALVRFPCNDSLELLHAICLPYPDAFSQELRTLAIADNCRIEHLAQLDRTIAQLSVEAIRQLLQESGVPASQICAIGSHGHTLRHRALRNRALADGFSWQIGDPGWIAEHTGITCIADFRRRDIAAGGQGAPLVPAFHQSYLCHDQHPRMVLNIGGIANLTALGESLLGFDCGPGNALMDEWCQQQWGQPKDNNGERAASGTVIESLLESWTTQTDILEYFQQLPPKSTGRELFNLKQLNLTQPLPYKPEDVLATLAQLTVAGIEQAVKHHGHQSGDILVCGGGLHNQSLLQRIQLALPGYNIKSTKEYGVHPDWLEAIAFAWLAFRTTNQLPGNEPSVTGAKGKRILGGIYPA